MTRIGVGPTIPRLFVTSRETMRSAMKKKAVEQ